MSGLTVTLVAGKDKDSSSVKVEGSIQHVITDEERETFNVKDSKLKEAVEKYFGKKPNDAYLHSSTPWGDLYKTYKWEQTQMVLVATSAEILEITSNPVALKSQTFENYSSHEAEFNVSISDSVTHTTTSSWSTGGTLSIEQKFKYNVEFLGAGGGGETTLSYSQSWGIGGSESKSITVGSGSGVTVSLKPQQAVEATLSASQGVMKVRIHYEAKLTGTAAVNYNPTYKGHHFWDLPINSVMSADKISNSITSTEDIELGYFSNGTIEIKDKETDEMVSSHYLPLPTPAV